MSIADHIRDDLRSRLESGEFASRQLTLNVVADLYEVSTTPVREAVNALVDEGLLEKRENRRLIVVASGAKSGSNGKIQAAPPPDPIRALRRKLGNELLWISMEGEPVHIREEATADKHDVSRAAIRNAFHHFAGTGLLEHLPRRGWVIKPFRLENMNWFLEIRELMELKALDLAKDRLNNDRLQEILDGNQLPKSDDDEHCIDNSLHDYFIDTAGNPYIREFIDRHGRYYQMLSDWDDLARDRVEDTIRQHQAILEAALAKDWDRTKENLSKHIRLIYPYVEELIDRRRKLSNRNGD